MRKVGLIVFAVLLGCLAEAADVPPITHLLPTEVIPELGCWFWTEPEFEPNGYKPFLDLVAQHSPYNLLTTSLRVPLRELPDAEVHAQIREAAIYARKQGIGVVMDLDVRLARRAFEKEYPEELQEKLYLQEAEIAAGNAVAVEIHSEDLNDHYTNPTTHYIPIQSRFLRAYVYIKGDKGIKPDSLRDITTECSVIASTTEAVKVSVPSNQNTQGKTVCILAAFSYLSPDVFAPHLLDFQRKIMQQYADVPLAGVCKDEWGFPPCFDGNPKKNAFWFSRYRAEAYAQESGGRDLIADCLLMYRGIEGLESERIAAINRFMEMSTRRNGAIEQDFYRAVKAAFGAEAVAATHPTWWPYPEAREFEKNGLDWWAAKRDWAQTDETTPYAVRTSLTKKWGSPVWFDMYYAPTKKEYEQQVWAAALSGGRINYHPLLPSNRGLFENCKELLRGDLMQAECRIRLLNFITQSPLDCPVAVVFGHANAMNWAGSEFNDVGMELADALWRAGYPADLIPSSEIDNHSLRVNEDGGIQYGVQWYSALVLYHPEYEKSSTADFFQKAASGHTKLFRVGNWTTDVYGKTFDGKATLPKSMVELKDDKTVVDQVLSTLRAFHVKPQTPAISTLTGFAHTSACPPAKGYCRLIDGTEIHVSAAQNPAGDPIRATVKVGEYEVTFDAVGLAAVRLDAKGKLTALAAGQLRQFQGGGINISLSQPIDLALWLDQPGQYHGVLQGFEGAVPETLKAITADWQRLALPQVLEKQ